MLSGYLWALWGEPPRRHDLAAAIQGGLMCKSDAYGHRALLAWLFIALFLAPLQAAGIKPFSSDGCSLFPDGTPADRQKWCGCCFEHDISYWQGGTEKEREAADAVLRDCVLARTGDKVLAESMYAGVRVGGHPVSVMWYRWGYGWELGRGYKPLTEAERQQSAALLEEYRKAHLAGYCGAQVAKSTAAAQQRQAAWATPVASGKLKNFYKLDDKVYRSAQPDKKGFKELKDLGIKNILNLRDYHKDKPGKDSGLNLYSVEMDAGKIYAGQVVEALRFIKNSQGPVLIHCWHGSDRTGTVSAMYRIVFQDWTKDAAIEELMSGGYGYHNIYKNIPEFIRQANIEEIRKKVMAP